MNKNVSIRITKDQLDLFRTFIGNQNITDKEILTYFDMTNPKVMVAAERYFKKKYGTECLTLNYYFPNQQNTCCFRRPTKSTLPNPICRQSKQRENQSHLARMANNVKFGTLSQARDNIP